MNAKDTSHLGSLGHTWIISPSTLNEFRFGFTRVTDDTYNQTGPQAATYGFNTGYPAGAPTGLGDIPNITFSGGLVSSVEPYSNLGASGNNPAGNWINTLQWIDNFSHITPRHEWKFGGEVRNIRDNRLYDLYFNGQLGFHRLQQPARIPNPLRGLRRRPAKLFSSICWQLRPQLSHHAATISSPRTNSKYARI